MFHQLVTVIRLKSVNSVTHDMVTSHQKKSANSDVFVSVWVIVC